MKRWREIQWAALLLALALALSGCAGGGREDTPPVGPDNQEELPDMETLLTPNGQGRFDVTALTVSGQAVSQKLGLWAPYLLDLLGPAAEEFSIPEYDGADLSKVLRFSDGSEMRCWTDPEERERPLGVTLLCLAGGSGDICGVRVGDHWTDVVGRFAVEEPQQTVNSWGEEIWLLDGEPFHMQEQGFVAMEDGRPSYLFYGDEASLYLPLDREGYVTEVWYNRDGGKGEHYQPPALLYPYEEIAGAGIGACVGRLQGDMLQPLPGREGFYITQEGSAVTVRHRLPRMGEGDAFTVDRTEEIQDAAVLFLSSPEAETVTFSYEEPLYGYGFSEVAITREEAERAVGVSLSAPADGDWSAFDQRLRSADWTVDAMDTVSFDHVIAGGGSPLADNGQQPFSRAELDGSILEELDDTACAWLFGEPVSAEDIPAYDGAASYRVFTYRDGTMAGGWVGEDGGVDSVGALYLTGDGESSLCGIRLGDSADRVLRSFQVESARETALPDVGAEDAVVLYGEVIHMGTYGYAVREEGRYTRIVYANGDSGVITFLLDGEERVSAVRFQMEGQMALPLAGQAE